MKAGKLPPAIFVTGTDTGIGKTVVSALLALGLSATYWKPIQSGLQEETDTEFVKRVTGLPGNHFIDEQYRLTQPLSPHASAEIDGISIDMSNFVLPKVGTDYLIIEGAGGLMVPMNDQDMMVDLIKHLQIPALLVVRSELGTLNHTFLSLEALRKRNISILGIIMNGPKNKSNRKAIEKYGEIEVLGELETAEKIDQKMLISNFKTIFNR